MNQQFRTHCTQTAFSLAMSASAISELHYLVAYIPQGKEGYGWPIENKNTESYLLRRGLIGRPKDSTCQMNWVPTNAGYLVSALLEEAGFDNKYKKDAQSVKESEHVVR